MQQAQLLIQILQHITDENKLKYLVKELENFNDAGVACDNTFATLSRTTKMNVAEKKLAFRKAIAKKFFEKYPNFKNAHSAKQ